MKQKSAEEKRVVFLLTSYGLSGAVAGLSFAHENRLGMFDFAEDMNV